jgi:hypothetical protein
MISRRITFGDLAAVGRVDRHKLRNLLKDVPEFASRPASERVASEYSPEDLMVVAVLCELERMGLRKEAIGGWVAPIQRVLQSPPSTTTLQMFLSHDLHNASLVDSQRPSGGGVVVDLGKVLTVVNGYCHGVWGAHGQEVDLDRGRSVAESAAARSAKERNRG